jgi:leader peptidase (prepilin peptidase)/N-methyltransferase
VYTLEALAEVDAAFPWFFPTCVFVLGAVVGSFLNVCIYRIPAEKSVITPRSTCACGRPIAWYDNIPIVSWIVLRGRARCCGQRFSIRYPFVELLTALLFLACWLQQPPVKALAGMFLTAMLIIAAFTDFDHMIIPDRCSIGTAVIGVLASFAFPAIHDLTNSSGLPPLVLHLHGAIASLIGWLIGAGLVITIGQLAEVVLRKDAMGLGDVKLVGAIGAFFGWQGAVFCVFGGAVIGTVGLGLAAIGHGVRRKPAHTGPEATKEPADAESPLGFGRETPFGPMLSAGALVYFLWLHPVVDGYFDQVADILAGRY